MGLAGAFVQLLQIHGIGIVRCVPQVLCTAKVNELQVAFCIQQQVLWLEVSVNDLQASMAQVNLLHLVCRRLPSSYKPTALPLPLCPALHPSKGTSVRPISGWELMGCIVPQVVIRVPIRTNGHDYVYIQQCMQILDGLGEVVVRKYAFCELQIEGATKYCEDKGIVMG